jgi:alpha-galactosidase
VEAIGWGGKRWNEGGARTFTAPHLVALPGVTFVSEMQWVSSTAGANNTPYRDTNYLGKSITIGGKVYLKGVWTHSFNDTTPADIVLDVEGKGFGMFAAEVGLDDASGAGSVQFQVLVDGAVAGESPVLRPRERPSFRVPLEGARTVALRVLNGGDGYSCDHAAWGLARFIAAGSTDPLGP